MDQPLLEFPAIANELQFLILKLFTRTYSKKDLNSIYVTVISIIELCSVFVIRILQTPITKLSYHDVGGFKVFGDGSGDEGLRELNEL